jgi:hypothetical protein
MLKRGIALKIDRRRFLQTGVALVLIDPCKEKYVMTESPTQLAAATVVWQRIDGTPSLEHMSVVHEQYGYRLCGLVLSVDASRPLRVDDEIACDPRGAVTACIVEQVLGPERQTLTVQTKGQGWLVNGEPVSSLDG